MGPFGGPIAHGFLVAVAHGQVLARSCSTSRASPPGSTTGLDRCASSRRAWAPHPRRRRQSPRCTEVAGGCTSSPSTRPSRSRGGQARGRRPGAVPLLRLTWPPERRLGVGLRRRKEGARCTITASDCGCPPAGGRCPTRRSARLRRRPAGHLSGARRSPDAASGAAVASRHPQGRQAVAYIGREQSRVPAALACAQLGAVFVPVNTGSQPPEVLHVLLDWRVRALIHDSGVHSSGSRRSSRPVGISHVITTGDRGGTASPD